MYEGSENIKKISGVVSENSRIRKETSVLVPLAAAKAQKGQICYKESEETIHENMMNHPYFLSQVYPIFILLIGFLVLDISIYQSFVQLIFSIFILSMQFIWVFRKGDLNKNVNQKNLSAIVRFIKYILLVQTIMIYFINIRYVEKFFNDE